MREKQLKEKKKNVKQIEKLLKPEPVSKPDVYKPLPHTVKYVKDPHIMKLFPKLSVNEDKPSSSSTGVVSQDKYYHKKPFNREQSWKPRSDVESTLNVKSPDIKEGNGKWIEIIFKDDTGNPIASKAWVPL